MAKISAEIIERIPELYEELGTYAAVARELNISASTVAKYMKKNNEELMPKKSGKLSEEKIQEINDLFMKCGNLRYVANLCNVSESTVKKHLTKEGKDFMKQVAEDWDTLWFYVYRLFGKNSEEFPVSEKNIYLMQRYFKQGYTYRGQLLTLKYFYEVRKHKVRKDKLTVGIIPYVYLEAVYYYQEKAKNIDRILTGLKKQLKVDRQEIQYNPQQYRNKRKMEINWEDVE